MSKINKTLPISPNQVQISTESLQRLSAAGKTFWDFLQDKELARGNEPRENLRKDLILIYGADLFLNKSPSNRFMQIDHGFIQWLFPLTTRGVNRYAPVLLEEDYKILKKSDDCKSKIMEHFLLFTEFMGIKYNEKRGQFKKTNPLQWESWIEHPDNNLRINRILISLKNFGLEKTAKDFLKFLQEESKKQEGETIEGKIFKPFSVHTRDSCENFWSRCL